MAELVLKDIKKSYGKTEVIHGVDLNVEHGEFIVFVGPSGCGKSTMLRMIAGLEETTDGQIMIGGNDVTNASPSSREIAMVFQSYALFPHMTVAENIGFGMKLAKVPQKDIDSKVLSVAKTLKVDGLLDRMPRQLSGGQRQRVAIGRAIIRKPKVFLFDEPLSNLDAALRVQTRLEIAKLHANIDATMIYVTHDQTEAMTLADKIVVFNAGYIEQVGTPMELYDNPANVFVAKFIGAPAMNIFEAVVENGLVKLGRNSVDVSKTANLGLEDVVKIGVRPEHVKLTLAEADSNVVGTVEMLEKLGAETLVYVRTELCDELFTAKIDHGLSLEVGEKVALDFDVSKLHCFDANTEHALAQL